VQLSSDDLPMFFSAEHARLAETLRAVAPAIAASERDVEGQGAAVEARRDLASARALGQAGLFALVAPASGDPAEVQSRALCLAREMLGYVSPRADSIFAVQGLGVHPLLLAGSAAQRAAIADFTSGKKLAAFALTEPDAGSDLGAIATRAVRDGDSYVLTGDKLFISNLGIADFAAVFAQCDDGGESGGGAVGDGKRSLTAFWVPLELPGVAVQPMQAIAAHPIGALSLRQARVPASARVGNVGQGLALALATLDAFRVSVGAAAVGMARRALDEAARHVTSRVQFGKPLSEQPLVAAHLADCAVDLDAARLLVLRAAYQKDHGAGRAASAAVSIAKLGATEAAQRVIDRAVQLLGGRGVMAGAVVEELYRAIRPLRIYEGTSEIQRTLIGRAVAAAATTHAAPLVTGERR
jgi:acyl-CoA dehydrogenase